MMNAQIPGQRCGLGSIPKSKRRFDDVAIAMNKTPFMILHEKFPLVNQLTTYTTIGADSTSMGACRFRCTTTLDNRMFIGEGQSKKLAKQVDISNFIQKRLFVFCRRWPNVH